MIDLGLSGKVAIVTGAGGAICGEVARALSREGTKTAILDISLQAAEATFSDIQSSGGEAIAVECDVTCRDSVQQAAQAIVSHFGTVDILVNGAGGGRKDCTTSEELEFFDISPNALASAFALNYASTVIPSQVFGRIFASKSSGVLLNISSIAALRPLTRALGYSNAKAAVDSFTQWLAVHMAVTYSPNIRVNAIAPGFMITEQNRFLLVDAQTGEMTERGRKITQAVPMRRYGSPEDIAGMALFLVSGLASFMTGAVVPIDGGFCAFSGV